MLERIGGAVTAWRYVADHQVPVRFLSGGNVRRWLSKSPGLGSKLIILDEPTAALGVQESRQVA